MIGAAMAIAFSILNIVGTFEVDERFPRCKMAAQLTFVIMLLSLGTNFIISEQILRVCEIYSKEDRGMGQ